MKSFCTAMLFASALASVHCAAQDKPAPAGPLSDRERIDYLLRQNQMLMEENVRLKSLSSRPRTKEEAFAVCMQAAKGETNPMAAESIGEHCDQLLKR
jgi:hypothetical protein